MNQGIPAILLDVYASAGFQVVFEQFLTKASPGDRPGPCSTYGDSQAGGDPGDGNWTFEFIFRSQLKTNQDFLLLEASAFILDFSFSLLKIVRVK